MDPSRRAATLPVWRIGSRAPLAPAEGHRPGKPPHQGEQNQASHTRIERAPPITRVLNEKATEHQQSQDRAGKKPRPSRQALQADAHALIVPRPAWPPWRSPAVVWPPTTEAQQLGGTPKAQCSIRGEQLVSGLLDEDSGLTEDFVSSFQARTTSATCGAVTSPPRRRGRLRSASRTPPSPPAAPSCGSPLSQGVGSPGAGGVGPCLGAFSAPRHRAPTALPAPGGVHEQHRAWRV